MARSTISRGAPSAQFSKQEQESYVATVDADPVLQAHVESIIGRKWSSLTFGEKTQTFDAKLLRGRFAAAISAANRAERDLADEAALNREGVVLADKVLAQEQTIAHLRDEIDRLHADNDSLRQRLAAATAAPAMAVHSGAEVA